MDIIFSRKKLALIVRFSVNIFKQVQILLFSLVFLLFTTSVGRCNTNLYKEIAKKNLKSLSDVNTNVVIKYDKKAGLDAYLKAYFELYLHPAQGICRKSIFRLLSKYEEENPMSQKDILDQKTWIDLEMLCGPKSNAKLYLASQLDRTITEAGRVAFYRKLVSPYSDISQLENQQEIIRHLLDDESLFNELDERLKDMVESENILLSYWYDENFYDPSKNDKIKIPFASKIARIKNCEDWINKTPFMYQAKSIKNSSLGLVWKIYSISLAIAGLTHNLTGFDLASFLPEKIYKSTMIPKMEDLNKFTSLPVWTIPILGIVFMKYKEQVDKDNIECFLKKGFSLLNKSSYMFWTVKGFSSETWNNLNKKYDYARVVHVARYMNNLKAMAKLVSKNKVLLERMPNVKGFNEFLVKLKQTSKDMHSLLELLEKKTFDGNYSQWFMYWGRVKVAFDLIVNLKDQFIDVMITVGELDAQLSIAKLYKEFKDKRVTFCFPKYIDPFVVDLPSVRAVDFWNPFIDSEKVVPSSLEVGQSYRKPQNVIITGPNAGGKSTITKAFVLSVILAQSLGIAPARAMEITPFNKIITYMNITDDIASGESHFKAGVLRAKEVVQTFDSLNSHEFGLTAIDEGFNGTSFEEGRAAAYSLIKILGDNPLGVCITNTHFKIIPTLEQSTRFFLNYRVSVIDGFDEKIQYPFKLEPGISDQNVAFRILKEEGFSNEFLDQAQNILDGHVKMAY